MYLSDDHHAAICGRDLVILDARAGQYTLVPAAGLGARLEACGRRLALHDEDLVKDLRQAGVVRDGVSQGPAAGSPPPPLPTRSVLDGAEIELRAADGVQAGLAWTSMLVDYYGRSFGHLIELAWSNPAKPSGPSNIGDLRRRALVFDQITPWIPFQGDCLFRSFMLLRQLHRAGFSPRWVFGVRTWPFYAHCWLQMDDLALTDYAETLCVLTPIFAVG